MVTSFDNSPVSNPRRSYSRSSIRQVRLVHRSMPATNTGDVTVKCDNRPCTGRVGSPTNGLWLCQRCVERGWAS